MVARRQGTGSAAAAAQRIGGAADGGQHRDPAWQPVEAVCLRVRGGQQAAHSRLQLRRPQAGGSILLRSRRQHRPRCRAGAILRPVLRAGTPGNRTASMAGILDAPAWRRARRRIRLAGRSCAPGARPPCDARQPVARAGQHSACEPRRKRKRPCCAWCWTAAARAACAGSAASSG